MVRHIDHKAGDRGQAADALEVRPEGVAGKRAIRQAASERLLKPHSILHGEDQGLLERGEASTGFANGASARGAELGVTPVSKLSAQLGHEGENVRLPGDTAAKGFELREEIYAAELAL